MSSNSIGQSYKLLFSILCSQFTLSFAVNPQAEEDFIRKFGNNALTSGRWERMRRSTMNYETMHDFVSAIHRAAFFGDQPKLSEVSFGTGTLVFSNMKEHKAIFVDFIEYVAHGTRLQRFYIMKGLGANSAHYLTKLRIEHGTYFILKRPVVARDPIDPFQGFLPNERIRENVVTPRPKLSRPKHLLLGKELEIMGLDATTPIRRFPRRSERKYLKNLTHLAGL